MSNMKSVRKDSAFTEGHRAKKVGNVFIPFDNDQKTPKNYIRLGPCREVCMKTEDSRQGSHFGSIHCDSEDDPLSDKAMSRGTANFNYTQNSIISGPNGVSDTQVHSATQPSTSTSAISSAADKDFPDINEVSAIGLGIYEENEEFLGNSGSPLVPLNPHVHSYESNLTEPQYAPPSTMPSKSCQVGSPAQDHTTPFYLRNGSNTTIWPGASYTILKPSQADATMPQHSSKQTTRQEKGGSSSKARKGTMRGFISRSLEDHKRTAGRPDAGDTILQLFHNVRSVKAQVDAKGRKTLIVSRPQSRSHQKLGNKHVSPPKRPFATSSTKPVVLTPGAMPNRSTMPNLVKTVKPVVSKTYDEYKLARPICKYGSLSITKQKASSKRGMRAAEIPVSESFPLTPGSISPDTRRPQRRTSYVGPRGDLAPVKGVSVRLSTQYTSLDCMEVPFSASPSVQYDAKRTYIDRYKPLPSVPLLLKVPKKSKNHKQVAFSIPDETLTTYPLEEPKPLCFSEAKPGKLSSSKTRSKQKKRYPTRDIPSASLPPSKGQGLGEVSAQVPAATPNKVRIAIGEDAQAKKPDIPSPNEKKELFVGIVQTLSKFHKPSIVHCKAEANKSRVKFKGHKISAPGPLITDHVGTANIAASSGGVGGPSAAFSTKLDDQGRPVHPHMRSQRQDNQKVNAVDPRSTASEHIPRFPLAKSYARKPRHEARTRKQCDREREERHIEPFVPNSSKEPLPSKSPGKCFLGWTPTLSKEHNRGRRRIESDASFGCVGLQTPPEHGTENRSRFIDDGSTPPDTSPWNHPHATGHAVQDQLRVVEPTDSRYGVLWTDERCRAPSSTKKRTQERRRKHSPDQSLSQYSATYDSGQYARPLVSNTQCVTQQAFNKEEKGKAKTERDSQYRDTRFYQLYDDVLREYED